MKPTTLVFPIDEQNRILLGRKKRGFGADKYNVAVKSMLVKAFANALCANYMRNRAYALMRLL